MIYGKTNVQVNSHESRSVVSDGLTKYITDDGLTKYLPKTAQISLVEKRVSKLKMNLKIKTNKFQNCQGY